MKKVRTPALRKKVHFRNIRLRNNAGIDVAECLAYADTLDTEKLYVTTGQRNEVTCKRCLNLLKGAWHA